MITYYWLDAEDKVRYADYHSDYVCCSIPKGTTRTLKASLVWRGQDVPVYYTEASRNSVSTNMKLLSNFLTVAYATKHKIKVSIGTKDVTPVDFSMLMWYDHLGDVHTYSEVKT